MANTVVEHKIFLAFMADLSLSKIEQLGEGCSHLSRRLY